MFSKDYIELVNDYYNLNLDIDKLNRIGSTESDGLSRLTIRIPFRKRWYDIFNVRTLKQIICIIIIIICYDYIKYIVTNW